MTCLLIRAVVGGPRSVTKRATIPFTLLPFDRDRVVSCSVFGAIRDFAKNAVNFLYYLICIKYNCLVRSMI